MSRAAPVESQNRPVITLIVAVSVCHFINDLMQSMLSANYPILSARYDLSLFQIGLIGATFHTTGSIFQPLIGLYTDKRPLPYSLPFAALFTLCGILLLAVAKHYAMLIGGAAALGVGSAIFHPEASRVARLASGGRYGFAQSIFQVGGNSGTAIGPLLVAFLIVDQADIANFAAFAVVSVVILTLVSRRSAAHLVRRRSQSSRSISSNFNPAQIRRALLVLFLLMLAKYVYHASIMNFYTFFAIEKFGLSIRESQILLSFYLIGLAVGTVAGGLLGDRFGAQRVIWFSIIGVLPFTLALPHVDLSLMAILSVLIGMILASAFPAIVIFAQELLPGRIGMVAGLCYGLSFGLSALSAAGLGALGDVIGKQALFNLCSYLPLLGCVAFLLPRPPPPSNGAAKHEIF